MGMRFRYAPLVFAAAALLSGCAAKHSALAPRVPVDVFFATDRAPKENVSKTCAPGKLFFDADPFGLYRAPGRTVSYGTYRIALPEKRSLGQLLDFPRGKLCLLGNEHPLFYTGPTRQERDAFFSALSARLAENPGKAVLVFIHGRNFRFDESVLWAAQLAHDIKFDGIPIVYSWPSRSSLFAYAAEEDNIEWSTPQLKEFLEQIATAANGRPVHLLAHSMGNRALLRSLRMMVREQRSTPAPKFGQVILAAPDLDVDLLTWLMPDVLTASTGVTLYFSREDSALRASEVLHDNRRAGRDVVVVPGMESVEVDPKTDKSSRRHNYFIQNPLVLADLKRLLGEGLAATQRQLQPVEEGKYWRLQP